MGNKVSNVTLSIHTKLPKSNLIKVENVLVNGAGMLTEVLNDGHARIEMTLHAGEMLHKLTKDELVFVHGTMNGHAFTLPETLEVSRPTEPWTVSGTV
jgi:hypothetical protein